MLINHFAPKATAGRGLIYLKQCNMIVYIPNQNKDLLKEINPKIVFSKNTENSSFFSISERKLEDLIKELRDRGYNPYSVMTWSI